MKLTPEYVQALGIAVCHYKAAQEELSRLSQTAGFWIGIDEMRLGHEVGLSWAVISDDGEIMSIDLTEERAS